MILGLVLSCAGIYVGERAISSLPHTECDLDDPFGEKKKQLAASRIGFFRRNWNYFVTSVGLRKHDVPMEIDETVSREDEKGEK